jgi:hypothetical protein
MKAESLLMSMLLAGFLAGCGMSVEAIRAKEPAYAASYAGQYKPFTTCVTNKIIEKQVPTVIFDDPNKSSTLSTWITDVHGRHLLNEATIVEVEPGKLKVEIRSMITRTIWGDRTHWTDDFIAALDACGKKI